MIKKTLKHKEKTASEILRKEDDFNRKNTSWGSVANWYDDAVEREGSYQRDLILPNLLRLLEIKKGDKILDIACGQGFFGREFAKAGAVVSATDISSELIAIAKERSKNFPINYFVSSADKISSAKDGDFDKATIVLAIQDVENLSGVLNEASRALKIGGKLFIVMNHPAFRIPKRSSWVYDEKSKIQYRRVDEYMSESRAKMEVHPGLSGSDSTNYFHRPLQTYFKAFEKAGFVVTRLEEWVSGKESEPGPKAQAENKARREFPMFMTIVLNKIVK